jgi:disulfide oxidoreductase YuzD
MQHQFPGKMSARQRPSYIDLPYHPPRQGQLLQIIDAMRSAAYFYVVFIVDAAAYPLSLDAMP